MRQTMFAFKGWNAPSKMRLRYFEALKHKWSFDSRFGRLNDMGMVTRHDFIVSKTLSKVKPII